MNNKQDYFYQCTNIPLLVINSGYLNDNVETMHNLNGYLQIINNNKIEVKGKVNRRLRGNGSIYNPKVIMSHFIINRY